MSLKFLNNFSCRLNDVQRQRQTNKQKQTNTTQPLQQRTENIDSSATNNKLKANLSR